MSNPRTSLSQGFKNLQAIQPNYNWRKQFEDNLRERLVFVFPKQENSFIRQLADFSRFNFALKQGVASLAVLILFSSGGLIYAARNSFPGDHLYALKRLTEKTRISLAFNQKQKIVLRAEIISNRLGEIKELSRTNNARIRNNHVRYLANTQSDIKKEIQILKKDLLAEQPSDYIGLVATDEISLPVNDDKQIMTDENILDIEQVLEETRKSLKENDLVSALQQTLAVENKLSGAPQATSTLELEQIESPVLDKTITPINLNNQKSNKKYDKKINPKDFGLDNFQRESAVKGGMIIREK